MTPARFGSPFAFALLSGVLLAGCAGESNQHARVVPAMPQVRPAPPAEPRVTVSRDAALAGARENLRRGEVAAAVRMVGALQSAEARTAVLRELAESANGNAPAQALELGLAIENTVVQREVLVGTLRGWTQCDPDGALSAVLALPVTTRFPATRALVQVLVSENGRAAVERIVARSEPSRNEALLLAVAEWTRRDRDEALRWVRALPEHELRVRALAAAGFELAQTEPERARPIMEELPQGRQRAMLAGAVAQTWIARDAEATMAWVRGLPADGSREAALAGVETGLGVRAMRRGSEVLGAGSNRGRIWGGDDPARLPLGPERDAALRGRFESLLNLSPAMAASWLDTLSAPDRSDAMIEQTAREWLRLNPVAAEAWMEQTIVSSDRREQLRRAVPR